MTDLLSGYVVRRDEDRNGIPLVGPNGRAIYLKVGAEDVDGAYTLQEFLVDAGAPWLNSHIHHAHDEGILVVEGQLSVRVGPEEVEAATGAFVFIPKGTPHCHSNPNQTAARYFALFNPAGMEQYFAELDHLLRAAQSGPFDRERAEQLNKLYQMERLDADQFFKRATDT